MMDDDYLIAEARSHVAHTPGTRIERVDGRTAVVSGEIAYDQVARHVREIVAYDQLHFADQAAAAIAA